MTEQDSMTPAGLGALMDLSFSKFITLSMIKIIYILGMALIGIFALIGVIMAFTQGFMAGVVGLIVVPIIALIYLLMLRVQLELIAVIFRIGDNTSATARALGAAPAGPAGFPVMPMPSIPSTNP